MANEKALTTTTYYIVTGVYHLNKTSFRYTRPFCVEQKDKAIDLSGYRYHTYVIKSS